MILSNYVIYLLHFGKKEIKQNITKNDLWRRTGVFEKSKVAETQQTVSALVFFGKINIKEKGMS